MRHNTNAATHAYFTPRLASSEFLFSTGGDEINIPCYDQDDETQEILNKTGKSLEEALDAFTDASHSAIKGLGKTPVVWEGKFWPRSTFF